MSNILSIEELNGIRKDFALMLGINDYGGEENWVEKARTVVSITRVIDRGVLNPTTNVYDAQDILAIYTGPSIISPVAFRRDRQEIGGQGSIRIRQYRAIVPWDAGDIHLDDVYKIDFSDDPAMNGRSFDVTDVMYEAELTVRRISLTDTSVEDDGQSC